MIGLIAGLVVPEVVQQLISRKSEPAIRSDAILLTDALLTVPVSASARPIPVSCRLIAARAKLKIRQRLVALPIVCLCLAELAAEIGKK